jgi:predicted RNase H-like HicB family nuclease
MRYAIVIEKGKKNYGVYVPDVPGCVSVGDTVEECMINIREALQVHFAGMREDGDRIPDPVSLVEYVDIPVTGSVLNEMAPRGAKTRSHPSTAGHLSKVSRKMGVASAKA